MRRKNCRISGLLPLLSVACMSFSDGLVESSLLLIGGRCWYAPCMPQLPPQSDRPAISAAIVLYRNDLGRLGETMASVARAGERLGSPLRLYLVDQSEDEPYSQEVAVLAAEYSAKESLTVQHIRRGHNGGYGSGHNTVPAAGLGTLHLLLNPDVVLSPDMLRDWQALFSREADLVLVAPRGCNNAGDEEYLAKRYPNVLVLCLRAFAPAWLQRRFESRLHHYELRDLPLSGPVQDVPLLSGCCMLVRGDAWQAIGGFDEGFFLYFEDYDLCQRLRSVGRVVRDPNVTIVHHGGQAARKGWRHILWFIRGGLRFFSIWGWRWV